MSAVETMESVRAELAATQSLLEMHEKGIVEWRALVKRVANCLGERWCPHEMEQRIRECAKDGRRCEECNVYRAARPEKNWCGICMADGEDTEATHMGLDGNGQAHFVCTEHAPDLFDPTPIAPDRELTIRQQVKALIEESDGLTASEIIGALRAIT